MRDYPVKKPNKIIFIHNQAVYYRLPVFEILSKKYNLKFLFYHEPGKVTELPIPAKSFNFIKVLNKKPVSFSFIGHFLFADDYSILIASDPQRIETVWAVLLAKTKGKKVILWCESWDWPNRSFIDKIYNLLSIIPIKLANAYISPGQKTKEFFLKRGVTANKIFMAPNARELAPAKQVKIAELKRALGVKNQQVILYLSRIIKMKGLDYLIKAFADLEKEIENLLLLVVGDGEFKSSCEKLAKELQIKNIKFVGEVPHAKAYDYLSLCHVFVLPSINYEIAEAWGLVLNEAMALGKPIVATDMVGAAHDLIKNGENGFIVPEKKSSELYKALKTMLSDPELIKKMGGSSQKIIKNGFTYDKMAEGFEQAINYLSPQ